MVKAAAQYRNALKRRLPCIRRVKRRLLEGFDGMLTRYLEENPSPTPDDLSGAFGAPEEMAHVLMAEVTPRETEQYRRRSLFTGILAAFLAAILLFFTVYIWFYKEVGLTVVNEVGVDKVVEIDENDVPASDSTLGDDIS